MHTCAIVRVIGDKTVGAYQRIRHLYSAPNVAVVSMNLAHWSCPVNVPKPYSECY